MARSLTRNQMRRLYKGLLKRGIPRARAYKITGIAKSLSRRFFYTNWKIGKFGKFRNFDFDGDGKVNKYDCKPFNRYAQDNKETAEERNERIRKKHEWMADRLVYDSPEEYFKEGRYHSDPEGKNPKFYEEERIKVGLKSGKIRGKK